MKEITKNSTKKMITCIVYRKAGLMILKALEERGFTNAFMHNARGSAIGDAGDERGRTREFEKEIVTVVVENDVADEVFTLVFDVADINRVHGGLIYMGSLHTLSSVS